MCHSLSTILRNMSQTAHYNRITRCAIAIMLQIDASSINVICQTIRDAALGCDARLQSVMFHHDALSKHARFGGRMRSAISGHNVLFALKLAGVQNNTSPHPALTG